MKGNQHVYECQVQIDQKCCVCALYKNRGNCNHLNGAGYRWINDNCLNCGADLTGAKVAEEKNYDCACHDFNIKTGGQNVFLRPSDQKGIVHTKSRCYREDAEPRSGELEPIKTGPKFTKHKVIYDKVNEIINHLNSKPEN